MKVPKIKYKVNIRCKDGTFVTGNMHVKQGLRIIDALNDEKETFLAITEAKLSNIKEVHSFQLYNEFKKQGNTIFLSKAAIKWLEGIK